MNCGSFSPNASAGPWRLGLVTAHSDRRVWQQARALLEAKWEAEVFPARDLETLRIPHDVPSFTARREGRAEAAGRRTRSRLYALATRLGFARTVPVYHSVRAILRPLAASIIAKHRGQLLAAGYHALVAHDLPTLPLCALVAAQTGARVVYDSHELYPDQALLPRRARRYWAQVEATHIGKADLLVTVSPGLAEEMTRRHHFTGRAFVLPNACLFRPMLAKKDLLAKLYALPKGRPIVLCQGGLVPQRGLEMLLDAWPHLSQPRPLLVFLGQGPLSSWIARRIARGNLLGTVFVGHSVPADDLLEYTACADLGVIPYRSLARSTLNTQLSCPNRLFEYLMARVPTLAWDLPEIRRVLDESRTGMCATWQTPGELASRIKEALSWSSTVTTEAREAAARRFSFDHYQPQWLAALSAMMEEPRSDQRA